MDDFTATVTRSVADAEPPVGLLGWSMGGLVALMAASQAPVSRLVLLEPSPPAEIQGSNPPALLERGAFDPEEAYGAFPRGVRSRMESALARAERKRGISIPSLPCRTLVVYGAEFPEERGRRLAAFYGCATLAFPNLDHWGLVRAPAVRQGVGGWLAAS